MFDTKQKNMLKQNTYSTQNKTQVKAKHMLDTKPKHMVSKLGKTISCKIFSQLNCVSLMENRLYACALHALNYTTQ